MIKILEYDEMKNKKSTYLRKIYPNGPLRANPNPYTFDRIEIITQYKPAATVTVELIKYISKNNLVPVLRYIWVRSVFVHEFKTKPDRRAL